MKLSQKVDSKEEAIDVSNYLQDANEAQESIERDQNKSDLMYKAVGLLIKENWPIEDEFKKTPFYLDDDGNVMFHRKFDSTRFGKDTTVLDGSKNEYTQDDIDELHNIYNFIRKNNGRAGPKTIEDILSFKHYGSYSRCDLYTDSGAVYMKFPGDDKLMKLEGINPNNFSLLEQARGSIFVFTSDNTVHFTFYESERTGFRTIDTGIKSNENTYVSDNFRVETDEGTYEYTILVGDTTNPINRLRWKKVLD